MAWVTSIEQKVGSGKIQPTRLSAIAKVFETEPGTKIVQLDTFGSADRQMPGKQSQTLQLGQEAAEQLFRILKETYDFK